MSNPLTQVTAFLQLGKDHTLEYYSLDGRPDTGSCFIQVLDGNGSELVSSSSIADLDAVNTTILQPSAKKDMVVSISSSADLVPNRRYLLGSSATQRMEVIEVADIDRNNNQVTLKTPLCYDHVSGSTFQGIRVSYTLSASVTSGSLARDNCLSQFRFTINSLSQSAGPQAFDLCRFAPKPSLTPPDIFMFDHTLRDMLPDDVDVNEQIQIGYADLLNHLKATGVSPGDLRGNNVTKRAELFRVLFNLSQMIGSTYQDVYWKNFVREIELVKQNAVVDTNRDGVIDPLKEKFPSSFRMIRTG